MGSERRTVADALEADDKIGQFISNGLAGSSLQGSQDSPETGSSDADEAVTGNAAPSNQPLKRKRVPSKARKISDEQLSRTFAKSVIQKTVRFKPKLIAQLEDWIQQQEANGNTQKSFQQIQNEALELWLDKNP